MRALREPRQFLIDLGELIRPKDEESKRRRGNYSLIIAGLAGLVLLYRLFT